MFNDYLDGTCLDFDLLLLEEIKAIVHAIDADFMHVFIANLVTSQSSLKNDRRFFFHPS